MTGGERLRPRALRRGDVLGVCAPAGVVDGERLERGVAELRGLGFDVRVPEGVLERQRFTAGDVDRRAAELLDLFSDPRVAGIVCARGGAGSAGVLPRLDGERLRAQGKVFVGYSDITFLHLFLGRLGLVTVHGPMVARELAEGTYDPTSLLHALTGEGVPYASEPGDLLSLRPGAGEGILRGGCLSILAAAAGTPWALRPDPEGTVLFLEDVHERPFRVERMLFQLRQSGALDNVKGIVFGDMKGCAPRAEEDYELGDVLLEALRGLEIPIAMGLSSGHTATAAVSLPLGVRARLTADEDARLEVLEPAVASP
jgi:muramoyltetrapeptide carboxypeptidase